MTNKHDEEEPSMESNPRLAALLAMHLVSQVMGEAYVIANAALDSGTPPWRYLAVLKNFKHSETGLADDDDEAFEASKGDNVNDIIEANIVATSTPQKIAAKQVGCSDETLTAFIDSTLIGQGDQEVLSTVDIEQNDSINSTSMFINHLFDMSDVEVEQVIFCEDTDIVHCTSEPNDLLAESMNKIMDSYVANACQPLEEPAVMGSLIANTYPSIEDLPCNVINDDGTAETLSRSDHSEYSFLADAFVADIVRDVAFYIDEDSTETAEVYENLQTASVEDNIKDVDEKEKEAIKQKNDFELYEKAYMTLNRDYDQCSEDDGYPILQDPKEMILQEVELMTANTSNEELRCPKASVSKPREEEATVSGISGSRRSTLARRCRIQGARIFACIRGWWRRKAPGKRKESRRSGLAVCPLSPDARRRASSLLDNRLQRPLSPSNPVMWKFNTVNEALVNSNRWKDYTFDVMAEGNDDL